MTKTVSDEGERYFERYFRAKSDEEQRLYIKQIVQRLKVVLNVARNEDVSFALGYESSACSNWIRARRIPHNAILSCQFELKANLGDSAPSLDWFYYGEEPAKRRIEINRDALHSAIQDRLLTAQEYDLFELEGGISRVADKIIEDIQDRVDISIEESREERKLKTG